MKGPWLNPKPIILQQLRPSLMAICSVNVEQVFIHLWCWSHSLGCCCIGLPFLSLILCMHLIQNHLLFLQLQYSSSSRTMKLPPMKSPMSRCQSSLIRPNVLYICTALNLVSAPFSARYRVRLFWLALICLFRRMRLRSFSLWFMCPITPLFFFKKSLLS